MAVIQNYYILFAMRMRNLKRRRRAVEDRLTSMK